MSEGSNQYDRTIALGDKAYAHIRSHRCAAHPRSYELWYAYVSDKVPGLVRAINEILSGAGRITQNQIDALYDRFLHSTRALVVSQRATTRLMNEMQQIDGALNTARDGLSGYAHSLERAHGDLLDATLNREGMQRLVDDLKRQTSDVERVNTHLAGRLSEALGELASLQEMLEGVRAESQRDPVTTLINRQTFDHELVEALGTCVRTRAPMSLLMVDIDFFKVINDNFGHLTGDQVLRLVAQTIRQNLKGQDVVARFGGEEFVVILPDTRCEDAAVVAEHLRGAVMSRELVKRSNGQNLGRVTVSIGVAGYEPGDSSGSLIDRADNRLYVAKRIGRNKVVSEDILPMPPTDPAGSGSHSCAA
jgi:diguanylate cyclase